MKKPNIEDISLEERYANYTDDEIRDVLAKRKQYRKEAVDIAIKIAIERGIIHSEQDLFGVDFNATSHRFSFFPEMSDSYLHQKFQRSMFRAIYIVGLIPVVFGIMKYSELDVTISVSSILLGFIWIVLTLVLQRKKIASIIYGHFVILLIAFFLTFKYLVDFSQLDPMDIAVLLIGIGMPVYLLVYIRKIFMNQESGR